MAQPNFPAIVDHLQGIQNEVRKVSNMPAIADQNGLQQQINTNYMKMIAGQNRLEQKLDANHTEIMTLMREMQGQNVKMQGQLGEILNEYVSLSSFG